MNDKDDNYLIKVEKAIQEKYGDEAIQNPKASWDEEKEIKKIIKKNYNKPEKMTKELSDMFGIKHVPKINNDNN